MGDELSDILTALRKYASGDFASEIAKRAAVKIDAALSETLAAGETPDGKPWAPRKKGGRAYANAASKLTVKSYGDVVKATVTGGEAYGNFGAGGTIQRQMLPDAGAAIPQNITDAIKEAAAEVLKAVSK